MKTAKCNDCGLEFTLPDKITWEDYQRIKFCKRCIKTRAKQEELIRKRIWSETKKD